VITTFRGGTGAGATLPAAALLRSVMSEGSIRLHSVMPDVYGGDNRAYANAYAVVRELQYAHRFNGGVKLKGGRTLPAPFESASLIFASNGAVALQPGDALMQEAAILRAYLRARTQSTINSRLVDLTDVIPYTINDDPMHVSVETAVSIRNIQPGTLEYMATQWCGRRLEETQAAFEEWCQGGSLSVEDSERVAEVARAALKDLNINRPALLSRIDGTPGAANVLRAFFEQASATIGSMDGASIKKDMGGMPAKVRSAFQRIEPQWQERACNLARALPEEMLNYVMSRLADAPHLALAALGKLIEHLTQLAKECRTDAEAERKRRDAAGAQLAEALNAVQEVRGILGIIGRNEVTRDAAQRACSIAMQAALSRIEQQRLELLVQALEGEFSSADGRGRATTVPAVTSALRDGQVSQIAAVRKRQAAQLAEVKTLLSDLGQALERRSPIFHRALVYDGANRKSLNKVVREVSDVLQSVPPIQQLLKGEWSLQQTVNALLPMLPNYTEFGRPLSDVLAEDPKRREVVIRLLRNRVPFTPLDHVVEDQQGLKNRRDTLVVLEIPGGADGPLAQLMLSEAIVSHRNQIVDSGEDEIRLYYLREGLPYAAVRPLAKYKERHDTYQANPAAVTPYTQADARNYPGVAPSRVNLSTHTEEILFVSKAVLPERVIHRPSGGYVLRYEKESGHGFTVTQEETFGDMGSMVTWAAKEVSARKLLESELLSLYDSDPEA
ncbi:MAG TPA: tubulin-like doman-containing protein, partial [Pyrinomonadaceae bacterium]|nr:tubulin-like doman-containing protein [Pyrinomonadaceae bacterium]